MWKTEYVTAIPKKSHPESLNDLRNISCTALFSKVYEGFILARLGDEVGIRENQFGGMKGAGTEHFLVLLWQKILQGLEDQRAAVLLTSIDYSKAFNRLSFPHCISSLAAKGTSSEMLRLIASFLSGRVMKTKLGTLLSTGRAVMGGVPQGSLLGVFLFNIAIDLFEAMSPDVETYDVVGGNHEGNEPGVVPLEVVDTDVFVPAEQITARNLARWREVPLTVIKYVDDNLVIEKANFELTEEVEGVRDRHCPRTQNLVRRIVTNAEDQGMFVNPLKTQLMVI